jgi:hypothetical protein
MLCERHYTKNLSVNCSAGLLTGCTGGFLAARWDVCGSGGPYDSCSGERRYKIRSLRIMFKSGILACKSLRKSEKCQCSVGKQHVPLLLRRFFASKVDACFSTNLKYFLSRVKAGL